MQADRRFVATVNTLTSRDATQFIYSPEKSFNVIGNNKNEVIDTSGFLSIIREGNPLFSGVEQADTVLSSPRKKKKAGKK